MKVDSLSSVSGVQRIYPLPTYNKIEKVPEVDKIKPELEKSSRQIQEIDLFKYYAQKGVQSLYPKGIYIDITK
mgnify:CR=1 FL=1